MSIFNCKNRSKSRIAELMLFVLNFYGVYPFTKNVNIIKRYRLIVYYLLMLGIGAVGNLVMLAEGNTVVAMQASSFLFGTASFCLMVLISIRNEKNLRLFLESTIEENDEWNNLTIEFDTYRFTYERIQKLHKWFAIYNVISCSSVVAYPLTNVLLRVTSLGDVSSLIFVSWYPWSVSDWRWYTITYIIQTLTASIYQSIMYATIAVNLITWRLFSDEFDELRYIVRRLVDGNVSQRQFDRSLKLCIVRYQTIVK